VTATLAGGHGMKLNRKLVAMGLLASSGVLVGLSVLGTAQADWTTPPDDESQDTTSEVATNLWCTWVVNGNDSAIELAPTVEGAEYEGEEFALEGAALDQEALVAGYVAPSSPTIADRTDGDDEYDCSWYNNEKGLSLVVTADGGAFTSATTADPLDNTMGWLLSDSGLAITYTQNPGGACAGWVLSEDSTVDADEDSTEVARINYSAEMSTTEDCSWDTTYSVSIPAGKEPAAPGSAYTFTGPTLVSTVEFLGA